MFEDAEKINVVRNDLLIMLEEQNRGLEFFLTFFFALLLIILLLTHVTAVQTLATFIKMTINKGSYNVESDLAKMKRDAKKSKKRRKGGEEEMELLTMP